MKYSAIPLFCLCSILSAAPVALDHNPEVTSTYIPAVLLEKDISSAEVRLLVEINAHGYVTKAQVKSSTDHFLDQACLDAIQRWRYVPAKKDGQPVSATFIQPLFFGERSVSTEEAKPKLSSSVDPVIPDALHHLTGSVTIIANINEEGTVTKTSVKSATNDELASPCMEAVAQWKFKPAIKAGKAVPSVVYIPFVISGRPLDVETSNKAVLVENHELKPRRQDTPDIPERLASVKGDALVSFVVDPKGYVSSAQLVRSSNPELGALALAAVQKWTFQPVVKNGVAVSVRGLQPFNFGEGEMSTDVVDSLPSIKHAVEPTIPDPLVGVPGRVVVQFNVGTKGEVTTVEIRSSTLPEMEAPVLEAAKKWTFKPAIKAGVAVESHVVIPIVMK